MWHVRGSQAIELCRSESWCLRWGKERGLFLDQSSGLDLDLDLDLDSKLGFWYLYSCVQRRSGWLCIEILYPSLQHTRHLFRPFGTLVVCGVWASKKWKRDSLQHFNEQTSSCTVTVLSLIQTNGPFASAESLDSNQWSNGENGSYFLKTRVQKKSRSNYYFPNRCES